MRIDKIELIGFKSFAEKTTFNFHSGITCIVGPNGCGKSNIVDAFRWVLGEQSAKSLRGERMEEVIFNGSVSKKPRGMAEVTMVVSGINGSQQSSPSENGEGSSDIASVTRRLYRSGESEYILNKNQCRLKDVKDLFLDTGLEVKSYSVLEQDRISAILNSKPQDRRFLIEEVAGVMKYNVRKKEAQAKLESSRTNLQRVNDIITEVKKQINLIDRLAKKAEKYKKLSSELRFIELKIAKKDYRALKNSFEEILSEYTKLREEDSLKRAELAKTENETETKRLELLEKEKFLEQVQIKFQNLEKEIAELEKIIAVARTERDNYKEYLIKLYQQEEEFNLRGEELLSKQKELENIEADLLSEIEKMKELLKDKIDFLRSVEEEHVQKEELLEERRREIFRITEELSSLRNDQSRLQSSFESLNQRESTSVKDTENLKIVLADMESSLKNLESTLLEKNNTLLQFNEKKGIIEDQLSESRNRIESLKETLSKLKEELASYTSRIESLREIIFDGSTKDLLSEDLKFNLIESISDVIEIEHDYEKAIESALSDKVNSFILSSFDDIEVAISLLKEKGLGRTAFIPVTPAISIVKTDMPEGVIDRALSFVQTKDEFSGVARSLFENIFIVKDLKTALNLISAGHNLYFVTLDGEVIEPSGAVIMGGVKEVFRKKREIRELEEAIGKNKTAIDHTQAELSSIHTLIERKESELKSIESNIVDTERECSLLRLTADNNREEKEHKSRKLAYLIMEMEQIIDEKESIEKLIKVKDAELQVMDLKKVELEKNGVSIQEEITQKRSDLEVYRAEVTDIRLSIASLKERIESINKERETVYTNITANDQKKEFLSAEISSIKSRILQRETEMDTHEEKTKSLVSVADGFKTEITERKDVIDTENHELLATEQGLKLLRNEINSLSQRVSELDVNRTEYKLKLENLCENVKQNYGSELDTIEIEPLTTEDENRLVELKEKVQDLGPVNLGTLEEYEELRMRYEFLTNQQEDLNRSIAELEEAITRINITTRKKLREAFEALKTKFSEVFFVLFGGGRADLVMTDEDNILETGIDIIAQPPGKRLQNINLLSGGEKALTALSLLFASFLIKPTPLCILDEADSPLDEANTERFARMIQGLSKDTQFIVVTHNRTTMSSADHLYGITMEEAGISKVMSMRLVEA